MCDLKDLENSLGTTTIQFEFKMSWRLTSTHRVIQLGLRNIRPNTLKVNRISSCNLLRFPSDLIPSKSQTVLHQPISAFSTSLTARSSSKDDDDEKKSIEKIVDEAADINDQEAAGKTK